VSGVVYLDDKPLATGTVQFYPQQGQPARGLIGADGSYSLTTYVPDDGALLGHHRVTVKCTEIIGAGAAPQSLEEEIAMASEARTTPGDVRWLAPQRYSQRDTSPLEATVAGNTNTIDLHLTTSPQR
jgi:hypothetical protein